MDSKKRKKSQEDSDFESESTNETQSKKKKVVVEHSSPEQDQSYHGSEIGSEDLDELLRKNNENSAAQGEKIPDVNLGSDDPSSQGHTEQSSVNRPAESMLSLVEESASEPADSNMMVVREETPFEGLAIVPIQVCLPVSQTTTVPEFQETPETEYEPTPLLQIEGPTKTTPEPPPQQLEESTPTLPPTPYKINPALEDVAALMMMARTASYVPKTDPMPSFSLGFIDSSQEETTTQEGVSTQDEHRAKTPETPKLLEQLEDLAIRVKTYADGLTDEFDNVCRLQAQDRYTLSKFHLASLAPKMHIEAKIVIAMCFILNQQNIERFQEEVYCLPLDIVDMDREIVAPYLKISGQKTSYDCAIYVLKWLEIFEPANIKRPKYEWDNWTQDEVDHFRVEYASRILFHDMNLDKDEAIRGSNAIRLSKPSSLLLSPYCQIDSQDVDTA
ncbi:uncharacterized protein DS421_20g693130 [Arachis hypogaea]|nr:uncharacterized protein DS421_20g693130 [Arachis hypogaea]